MEYTQQQLIDAYTAATGVDPADLTEKKVEMQEQIDSDIASLTEQINNISTNATRLVNDLQIKLDAIPLLAKDQMKQIAISYLMSQIREQTDIDNDSVYL